MSQDIDPINAVGDPSRMIDIINRFEAGASQETVEIAPQETVEIAPLSEDPGGDALALDQVNRAAEVLADLAASLTEQSYAGGPDVDRAAGRLDGAGFDLISG